MLTEADALSSSLVQALGANDLRGLEGKRIAMLMPQDQNYPCAQWGIWHAGGIAVPLYGGHPPGEMEYYVENSGASAIIVHPDLAGPIRPMAKSLGIACVEASIEPTATAPAFDAGAVERKTADPTSGAMIIYTSGTTGKPKGVVSTHANVEAQVTSLVEAWRWDASDRILHFLPLHHVHGVVNKLLCALWSGATVEFSASAKPDVLWRRLGDRTLEPLTLFMAVPTVYNRMLEAFDALSEADQNAALDGMGRLRLMVSGSAACPAPLMERWRDLTGHNLLERYGMTEIGMALSNPYEGQRNPGHVGVPLPGVSVRVVDPDTESEVREGETGELRVNGPGVFREYWELPEATAKEFDEEGWFKTGDIVRYNTDLSSFQICGRASTDIIKTGGYKISALEIEREILGLVQVAEVAVLGEPDDTWGERVVAVIRWKDGNEPVSVEGLGAFLADKLAKYKAPRKIISVDEVPKNAMGKVNKKTLLATLRGESAVV